MAADAWIALAAAVFGGAGLKIIEYFLSRSRTRIDIATQLRNELRQEVQSLRDELRDLETSNDKWRGRYYSLVSVLNYAKVLLLKAGFEEEVKELETQITQAIEVHRDKER